ncbi:hypothetical protein L3Q82_015147, partial [Scortum barcoo]
FFKEEESQLDDTGDIKHCHDNSRAQEDREQEKKGARKRLYLVSVICLVFMIGEILGGYFAGSLAVMTDASHLMVDLTSFIISLISLCLSSRPASHKLSYGWHRAEILGALLSVFSIWLVTGVLVYLAVERLISNDYTIDGTVMLITSGCAVLVNIIMALALHQSGHGHSHGGLSSHGHSHGGSSSHGRGHSHKEGNGQMSNHAYSNNDHADLEQNWVNKERKAKQSNASVRSAFVHVVGDLFQSISVFISAIIIYFKPEYKIADPICTFLFSIFVLCTTITIMRDILIVLMEGSPAEVKYREVRDGLLAVKGVTAVHNLHIWALTMNQALLSAHVAINESVDAQSVLRQITQACFSSYNFHSFADDTAVVGRIANNDESDYRQEVDTTGTRDLDWTPEGAGTSPHPLYIGGTEAVVSSWSRYTSWAYTSLDLTWSKNTSCLIRKAHQRLYFLRRLRRAGLGSSVLTSFYRCVVESVLSSCIIVWHGSCNSAEGAEGSALQQGQALQDWVQAHCSINEMMHVPAFSFKACKGALLWDSLTGNPHLDPEPPPSASSPAVSMTTPPLVSAFGGQPPPPQQQQQQQQQQAQAARDAINTASLCRIGQETVQDIVLRTMEIFQLLRNMQDLKTGSASRLNTEEKSETSTRPKDNPSFVLPLMFRKNTEFVGINGCCFLLARVKQYSLLYLTKRFLCAASQLPNGVTYHPNTHQDRLGKLQEHLRMLSVLFRKLRLVYDKCNENCTGMDPIPPEQLIPFVEDDSSKHEDRSAGQTRPATEERREILEVNKKLKQKNQQLKQIMDQLRNLIWEINSMLAVRS